MTENKTFPSTEPPPSSPIDPKLASVMISEATNPLSTAPIESSGALPVDTQKQTSVILPQPISQQEVKSFMPKKGPPKILLITLGALVFLIIITLAIVFLRREKPVSLVGTKGELTWWGVENDEAVVKPLIDEYVKNNPNVKIIYVKQSGSDYRERLINSLAQGKGPDIFEIHNSWRPMFGPEFATLPSGVMSVDTYTKSFYPVVSRDFATAAGVVAIPLEYDALTFFYNQDIFDSAAANPPTTWDEVAKLSSSLTQKGQKDVILQSGVALGLTENVDYWQDIVALMIFQNSANPADPSDKVVDALAFYTSFSTDLKVWNSTLPGSVSAFAKSKLGMLFAPTSAAKDIILENPNLRFKTAVLPQLPKNNPTDPDYSYASYWAQSVWKRSRNSEVAWDFLKYLSTRESLQKMNEIRRNRNVLEKAYPRPEMAVLQKEDKILGSILDLANNAISWYLYDKTNDGQTGLNTQMAVIYNDAIDSVLENKDTKKMVGPLTTSIKTLLAKYAIKK